MNYNESKLECDRFIKHEKIYLSALNSCPFCGEKKMLRILPQQKVYGGMKYQTWQIKCQICQASKELLESLESAILSWNKRPNIVGEDYWWFCKKLENDGVIFPNEFFKGHL